MNFMGSSISFLAEASEENLRTASDLVPRERTRRPRLSQRRVDLYSRPSDVVTGKKAGTAQEALSNAFVALERHGPQDGENVKKHLRPPALPGLQAGDLEDMEILVGEVYDERIIEDSLHEGKSYQ
jgi:hypothetical protein